MIRENNLGMVPLENALVDAGNPWPGLESYRESDQAFFHGREKEAQGLYV